MGNVFFVGGKIGMTAPSKGIPLTSLIEGTKVMIPENGNLVTFYLAKHDYESSLNGEGRILFVRKNVASDSKWYNVHTDNDYPTSVIDTWFNEDYLSRFDNKVKELIGTTIINYSVKKYEDSFTKKTLERPVFALSLTELGMSYTSGPTSTDGSKLPTADLLRYNTTYDDGTAATQHTRTIYNYNFDSNQYYVLSVTTAGATERPLASSVRGARPCFTLPTDCLVKDAPNADGSFNLIV